MTEDNNKDIEKPKAGRPRKKASQDIGQSQPDNAGGGSDGDSSRGSERIDRARAMLVPYNQKFTVLVDDLLNRVDKSPENPIDQPPAKIAGRSIQIGLWIMLVFFIALFLFGGLIPISSAAVAPGLVIVESRRKTIQHLEGGIVEEILVKEGQVVKKGAPLIRLQNTSAKARRDLQLGQYRASIALQSRLMAERDELDAITFPQSLLDERSDAKVQEIIEAQERLFQTRRTSVKGQINVLEQKIAQLGEQVKGQEAQKLATQQQIGFINEEIATVRELLKSGNAQKPRLLALERTAANLRGSLGQYTAEIAKAKQAINESELEIMNIRNNLLNEVATELRNVQVQLSDIEENLKASSDIFDRTTINAPIGGIITSMKVFTVGGVIAPGGAIMEIVPQGDNLEVEAQISPNDIDNVHPGLVARVRLVPLKSRRVPALDGTVINVSPDVIVDNRTGMPYYQAKIVVDQKFLESLKDVTLYPGMPVEIFIITGQRSMLSYLMSPLKDSMYRAFRES
jgi:HlyD family type I secretion membrane fusion protein